MKQRYEVALSYDVPYEAKVEVMADSPEEAKRLAWEKVDEADYVPLWDATTNTCVCNIRVVPDRPVIPQRNGGWIP